MRSYHWKPFIILVWFCLTTVVGWNLSNAVVASESDTSTNESKEVASKEEVSKERTDDDESNEEVTLSIGSTAPSIDIEHWFSDGDGRFEPIQEFESGKVYLVEFWATWCGPCVASMPHLAKLQTKYAEQGVQIISLTYEPEDEVEKFLDGAYKPEASEDSDQQPSTYRELTAAYCLTTDPDNSVNDDYMVASGRSTIPSAFLVGKTGEIEWIGRPSSLDEALAGVVNDTWDRDAFGKAYEHEREIIATIGEISKISGSADPALVLARIDKTIEDAADVEDEDIVNHLQGMRNYVCVRLIKATIDAGEIEKAKSITKAENLPTRWENRVEDRLFFHALEVKKYDEAMELLDKYRQESKRNLIRKRIFAEIILKRWMENKELPKKFLNAGLEISQELVKDQSRLALNHFYMARMQRALGDLPAALTNAKVALAKLQTSNSYERAIKNFIAQVEAEAEAEPAPEADGASS